MDLTSLGPTVQRRRRELSLGQEDLSLLAGVSVRFIRELEQGKQTVRLDKVVAVLTALGLALSLDLRQP